MKRTIRVNNNAADSKVAQKASERINLIAKLSKEIDIMFFEENMISVSERKEAIDALSKIQNVVIACSHNQLKNIEV